MTTDIRRNGNVTFPEPPLSRLLFADTRLSALWLVIRVWLGYQWFNAGLGKVGAEAWTGANAGAAIQGFVGRALEGGAATPWYASFLENVVLPNAGLFAYMVAFGEVLVGAALILGALTGIAAFFGTFMNLSFLLAGTVSSNPVMFVVGTWLVLAWRNAGWIGLDRWLLPLLGTPWSPGELFRERRPQEKQEPQPEV